MSTSRSSGYSRPVSSTRPLPPVGNSSNVSSITRSIQTGGMNITTNSLRQRPNSGTRQTSIDRSDIPNERETNSETTRSRLSTHHRSVSLHNARRRVISMPFRIQPMKNHHWL